MDMIQITVIAITTVYVLTWIFNHIFEPGALRRVIQNKTAPKVQGRIRFIEKKLFAGVNGKAIAERAAAAHGWHQQDLLYGDVDPYGFYQLLVLAEANDQDTFYDLGSGIGKAVFTAALCAEIPRCIGIELIPELYLTSARLLHRFYQLAAHDHTLSPYTNHLLFCENNFFNVDISDATLIFINATAFSTSQWLQIIEFFDMLSSGTRLIVTSYTLPDDRYVLLHEGPAVMSWGVVTCHIYQKI